MGIFTRCWSAGSMAREVTVAWWVSCLPTWWSWLQNCQNSFYNTNKEKNCRNKIWLWDTWVQPWVSQTITAALTPNSAWIICYSERSKCSRGISTGCPKQMTNIIFICCSAPISSPIALIPSPSFSALRVPVEKMLECYSKWEFIWDTQYFHQNSD